MFDQKEYHKQWYQDHKEEVKEQHKQYRLNHKEERREYNKQWTLDHPGYFKQQYLDHKEERKQYNIDHKEKRAEKRKQYCLDHKEETAAYDRQRRFDHPEYFKQHAKQYLQTPEGKATSQRGNTKRRVREGNIINTLTSQEWIDILKEYKFRCAYCGCEFDLFNKPTRDHVIPISKGGHNTKENIVPACQSCNSKKHNKINYKCRRIKKGGV